MGRIRIQDDGCGCIEFWHEHPEAPRGSGPGPTPDGKPTHWLRFVDMVDRVACRWATARSTVTRTCSSDPIEVSRRHRLRQQPTEEVSKPRGVATST